MFVKNNQKFICYTLDLEKDYGRINEYSSTKNLDMFLGLLKKYHLKLTVFVTGQIIKERPDLIKRIQESIDCEFNLHSYSHEINRELTIQERIDDMIKAKKVYRDYFHKNPIGYRAPQGLISRRELDVLSREIFLYDSSLIPTYRPGLFNNLGEGDNFFYHENGLLEIPISRIPKTSIPFSLSYFQFLGWFLIKFLIRNFKKKSVLVFNLHLHNLSKLGNNKLLSLPLRLFYIRNQNKGFNIFESFIQLMQLEGYQPVLMKEIYENFIS